jgi:hypothetical protein
MAGLIPKKSSGSSESSLSTSNNAVPMRIDNSNVRIVTAVDDVGAMDEHDRKGRMGGCGLAGPRAPEPIEPFQSQSVVISRATS